jgi:hypothetical protein
MDDRPPTALKLGARIFARPAWQVGTQAVSALVMFFSPRLVCFGGEREDFLRGVRAWLRLPSLVIDRRYRADTFLRACPNGKRN